MLRISLQTLRSRRSTLAGAFAAILLAVTVAYATGLLMAGALSAPGPGRLAAVDAVVVADSGVSLGDETEHIDPAPRLSQSWVARVAAVPGVERAVGDVAFRAGAFAADGRPLAADRRVAGHGWPSAALTPYRLAAGRPPAGSRDVVADASLGARVGETLRVVAPAGERTFRVSGVADGRASRDPSQAALFFAPSVATALSGAPGQVDAIGVVLEPGVSPALLRERLGAAVEVLDRGRAADADPGDASAGSRETLIGIFGVMGGIAGAVALFVVAQTFALAIAQRRRETAVMRALGATPRQVRRLIAGEALIVSLVAGALGVLAGGPLATVIADAVVDHGVAPATYEPGGSWIPLAVALGGAVLVARAAVIAAARRAGRVAPAEALRDAAVEHARPGWLSLLAGALSLAGGAAMAMLFSGEAALAFSILAGMLLATGVALLGRWLLGFPASVLSRPLRLLGAPGFLASAGLAANRWRTAALATPIVLVVMLVGTQAVGQSSAQRAVERVSAERVAAGHVVVGRDGAPLPAGTAARLAALPGVEAASETLPTELFLTDPGLGWDEPWTAAGVSALGAAGTLDLDVRRGSLSDVRGPAVAISEVVASEGKLDVGDVLHARMADTQAATLRVAAVYRRAAGLGHVLLAADVARRHAGDRSAEAVFVAGGDQAERSLRRYAATHPGVRVVSRSEHAAGVRVADDNGAWGVWLIVGMSVLFAGLSLVNTAAMTTAERRGELATIRLLGGTDSQALRMITLELVPAMLVALVVGGAVAALSVMGVPRGVRGVELVVPVAAAGGLIAGAALLGLAAAAVTARLALRTSAASAMRAQE